MWSLQSLVSAKAGLSFCNSPKGFPTIAERRLVDREPNFSAFDRKRMHDSIAVVLWRFDFTGLV